MFRQFLPIVLVTAVSAACDAQLSQWDRVDVDVGAPKAQVVTDAATLPDGSLPGEETPVPAVTPEEPAVVDTTAPVVDAGQDLTATAGFDRTGAVTDLSPTSLLWEQTSGPGSVTFSAMTALTTSVTASADGVYEIRLTATDAAGNAGSDAFAMIWDATAPAAPATLTTADTADGADTRIDDDVQVALEWSASDDGAGAGIRDYTVTWYQSANCAGTPQVVPGLTTRSQTVTGADGQTLSFTVKAFDLAGHESAPSACSPNILIDTTPPPPLAGVAVTAPHGPTTQTTKFTLTMPADVSDYARLDVRRGLAATAAPATEPLDCTVGTLAKSMTSFTANAAVIVIDDTGAAARVFSYRVCIYDAAGNVRQSDVVSNAVAKPHVIYVTRLGFNGALTHGATNAALTGIDRADPICNYYANTVNGAVDGSAFFTAEPAWRAILSSGAIDALTRVVITGKVRESTNSSYLADDKTDLFSGGLDDFPPLAEDGLSPPDNAWTGSNPDGTRHATNCTNWTSAAGGNGKTGDPFVTANDATWLSIGDGGDGGHGCASPRSLYCISQAAVALGAFTAAPGATAGAMTVSVQPPAGISYIDRIEVRRLQGATPDADCTTGGLITVKTLNPTIASGTMTFVDPTGLPGTPFTYRACVWDALGNILTSKIATGTSGAP